MFTVAKREPGTQEKKGKEAIHSGHFMVSQFEAEEQDDEYELAVPIPEAEANEYRGMYRDDDPLSLAVQDVVSKKMYSQQPLTIDTSLSKLFQCMSIAYRQKLTSPKWNRFRGIRLRWKDKIRLNNVIWRCWHMQFIKKINTYICQFASPLDVDTHNKPEAIVLEGKYWKRKLAAVTAEYKKWRMFYRNHALGHAKDTMDTLSDLDSFAWHSQGPDSMHMMVDEDYLGLMSDTLFSTITSQPFVFPDSREIETNNFKENENIGSCQYSKFNQRMRTKQGDHRQLYPKAGLADFIQPSLGPLQPNLDDYMDTFEPLHEFISSKLPLPTVPEEHGTDSLYRQQQAVSWCYTDLDLMNTNNMQLHTTSPVMNQYNPVQSIPVEKQVPVQDTGPQLPQYTNDLLIHPVEVFLPQPQQQTPQSSVYQSPVISKTDKSIKKISQTSMPSTYSKPIDTMYQNYGLSDICAAENRMQLPTQPQTFKLPQPSETTEQASRGYKFPTPSSMAPNLKFTSQSSTSYKGSTRPHVQSQTNQASTLQMSSALENSLQKEIKHESRVRPSHRGNRQRSISMSREPIKRPPLLSAISDPSLVTPANSVLLTQLLTNNSHSNLFPQSQSLGAVGPPPDQLPGTCIRVKEENTSLSIPQSQTGGAATLIITPVAMNSSQSSINDPLLLTSLGTSNCPSPSSSQGIGSSPTSPQGALGSPTRDCAHKDHRRVGHIHAEQKRRYNIKNGFDMIHSLIPHLNQNPNAKLSKAAMLQKGAEYIRQLQQERGQLKEEMDSLRQQIEALNTSISNCQSLLPATGAPVSRRRDSKMQEMFDEYVQKRTMEDWKFWIFSLLFRPLLTSFNNFVSTSSLEDLYRSTLHWVEQHCTLVDLRPVVLNSLRYLCTKTDILSEPEKLPEEARQAVVSPSNSSNQTQL